MVTEWFYAENLDSGAVLLSEQEAQHAVKARRLCLDAEITLFDGRGKIATAIITQIEKKKVIATIREIVNIPPPNKNIEIATAIPKGKRWQFLVEKISEIGATTITPLQFTRSVVVNSEIANAQRWSCEACKQSRRAFLPIINEQVTLAQLLQQRKNMNTVLLLCDADGENWCDLTTRIASSKNAMPQNYACIIGAEGGLTEEEIAKCASVNCHRLKLAPNILRIETAAIAATTLMVNYNNKRLQIHHEKYEIPHEIPPKE